MIASTADQECLNLLIAELPNTLFSIQELLQQKMYKELKNELHKLHGALCYCDTPSLKNAVVLFETALKEKTFSLLPKLFLAFEAEVKNLLRQQNPDNK